MDRQTVLKIYDSAVAEAGLERKGKTMPYTSANGYMFSQLNKDGELGIRLSKKDREEFDRLFGATPFLSYGATMKDYVLIPKALLLDQKTLAKYLLKGLSFVKSLPSK